MTVEQGLYIRLAPGDDVLVVNTLELDRARIASPARRVLDRIEVGWPDGASEAGGWAAVAARLLREGGVSSIRVSPRLQIAYFLALQAAGVTPVVDHELLQAQRRRKSDLEADLIAAAQRAAEAACLAVIRSIGRASVRADLLWLDDQPLTSEMLKAEATSVLVQMGCSCEPMIIAGSPESALPHHRGEGQLRAAAPIIIDIFPRHGGSHYHGDLTRTVVAGEVPEEVRHMHAAVAGALESAEAAIRAGADGREVHRTACRKLVEAGYGTSTAGFEGRPDGARMIHSTGHGVGLEIHEQPGLRDREVILEAGDVVTVEPGLYLPSLGGIRIEDTGLITSTGFRNLTTLPRGLRPSDYT